MMFYYKEKKITFGLTSSIWGSKSSTAQIPPPIKPQLFGSVTIIFINNK